MSTVFQGKLEGKRKRGRPAASLIGNITATSGVRIDEVVHQSQDREEWRRTVAVSLNTATNTVHGDADK